MKFLNIIALVILLSSSAVFANEASDNAKEKVAEKEAKKSPEDAAKAELASYEQYLKEIKDFEASDKFNPKLLTEELPLDVNHGDANAPIKIVEYASLSCIHCKQFHKDVFYDLKKNYIDTGKVYFKYRHYPLNAPAVKAAIVLDCVSADNKLAFMGALFEAQAQWAYSKSEGDLKEKLTTVSKIAGLTDAQFETCYADEAKQTAVLSNMKRAYEELFVTSTPGVFINGKRYMESREYETIAKYVDGLLAGQGEAKAVAPEMPAAETAAPAATTSAEPAKADKQ